MIQITKSLRPCPHGILPRQRVEATIHKGHSPRAEFLSAKRALGRGNTLLAFLLVIISVIDVPTKVQLSLNLSTFSENTSVECVTRRGCTPRSVLT